MLLLPPANRYQGAGQCAVMPRVLQSSGMSKCKHANGPTGYVEKMEWLERMSKRYKQLKCDNCGLYAKWVKQ